MSDTSLIKNSMRLFGLPYQFTHAVDPRLAEVNENVGTHFIRNIMVEGPIVTMIPGEPDYLPAENTKDKKITTTAALLEGAGGESGGFDSLKGAISKSRVMDYRLYDFKRDYTTYMSYVNILCRAGAIFLELDDVKLDGKRLGDFDWRDYRWEAKSYSSLASRIGQKASNALRKSLWSGSDLSDPNTILQKKENQLKKAKTNLDNKTAELRKIAAQSGNARLASTTLSQTRASALSGLVGTARTKYLKAENKKAQAQAKVNKLNKDIKNLKKSIKAEKNESKKSKSATSSDQSAALIAANKGAFVYSTKSTDDDLVSKVEETLKSVNYVQFYIDPQSGMSESLTNSTSESMMKGLFESTGGFMKDLVFMVNSGGIDASKIQELGGEAGDVINNSLSNTIGGTGVGSALSRLVGLGNETLKGNNIIMPDIYQSSEYSKSYSITVHLKSPYGTKLGYYLNIFVPMMHLLAFALPRQTSANSFRSPFLVKAYVDGSMTCNMGIVTSFDISRRDDSWSVDGLATEVDVTLQIADLYSDLSMPPDDNPLLFVNNPSLIEFLATNCGLSLTTPNIAKKAGTLLNIYKNLPKDYIKNVGLGWSEDIENFFLKHAGLTK